MGWLKSEDIIGGQDPILDFTYSAFASDVEFYVKKNGQGPRCPVCRKILKTSFIFENAVRVGEEPYAKFENTCECGAHIIVFNT